MCSLAFLGYMGGVWVCVHAVWLFFLYIVFVGFFPVLIQCDVGIYLVQLTLYILCNILLLYLFSFLHHYVTIVNVYLRQSLLQAMCKMCVCVVSVCVYVCVCVCVRVCCHCVYCQCVCNYIFLHNLARNPSKFQFQYYLK